MRAMTLITGFGFGLLLVLLPVSRGALALGQDQGNKAFLGDYKFQKVQFGDKEYPFEKVKDAKVQIDEDRITISTPDGKTVIRYQLRTAEKDQPRRITMVITEAPEKEKVGMHAKGLIEKQGETVRLNYDLEEDRLPKDFQPVDEQQHLIIMEPAKS